MKKLNLITIILVILPILLTAQEPSKYSIGMRSTIIMSDMDLSQIDPQFSVLEPNGIDGPHFNTVYFMVNHNSYFRYGFETFIANSNLNEQTTYAIQAAGFVAEVYYGEKFQFSAGIQLGAAIISAMANDGNADKENEVQQGTHFKSGGILFSPFVTAGYQINKFRPHLLYKPVFFGGEDGSKVSAFDGGFFGVGVTYSL